MRHGTACKTEILQLLTKLKKKKRKEEEEGRIKQSYN
jgi:hypothetical protein